MVAQAEAFLKQDPPVLPVSWEKINDGWYNYVKGHNPYNYFTWSANRKGGNPVLLPFGLPRDL